MVARSTRAWIETALPKELLKTAIVARSTRAWIETSEPGNGKGSRTSHALRVRGLKLVRMSDKIERIKVARSTRAWIETAAVWATITDWAVARSTRAWIETGSTREMPTTTKGRTLYACVD